MEIYVVTEDCFGDDGIRGIFTTKEAMIKDVKDKHQSAIESWRREVASRGEKSDVPMSIFSSDSAKSTLEKLETQLEEEIEYRVCTLNGEEFDVWGTEKKEMTILL